MKKPWLSLVVFLTLFAVMVQSQDERDTTDAEQDRRIEVLTERVKRLEALVGPDERPLPTRPTMGQRLDRLERERRDAQAQQTLADDDVQGIIREFRRALQAMTRQVDLLAQRLDRLERDTERAPESYEIKDLRREVDRLQRQVDGLRHNF